MTQKVLLVEDDPMIGEAVCGALSEAHIDAQWAKSGWEAMGFLAEDSFGLVLLDLGLPGRDGMSVLRDMRAKGNLTPVIILTARDGLEDRLAGLDAGADDYVLKPFHMSEVLAGPTGIVSGGEDAAAVAKAVVEFFKARENSEVKLGYFDGMLEEDPNAKKPSEGGEKEEDHV